MNPTPPPLVVQYLYVHDDGEAFFYPTARSAPSAARVAVRYLECALTQAATLRLREVDCGLALVINVSDRNALGRAGARLLDRLAELGVEIIPAEYRHRPDPKGHHETYMSSRYLLDAILACCEGQPEQRQLWLTDLDCVWAAPEQVFAAAPPPPAIGHIEIPYPPDWVVIDFEGPGGTRTALGELSAALGGSPELPRWIGGELLTGRPEALRDLVAACEEVDRRLAERGEALATEEQALTVAGALGLVDYADLSGVARRILTGPRHHAPKLDRPTRFGLWHLPSEKGLSLRRAAHEVLSGRDARLRRDLSDPDRLARRFNVAGTGVARRLRDDGWLASQRVQRRVLAALGSV